MDWSQAMGAHFIFAKLPLASFRILASMGSGAPIVALSTSTLSIRAVSCSLFLSATAL